MRADRQANGQGVQTTILGWSSLFLAVIESLCAAAVALSGVRVLLGMSSLIAATAAGPAHGFHREGLRVPILWTSGVLALLTLLLLWNEHRIRQNPAAQVAARAADAEAAPPALDAACHLDRRTAVDPRGSGHPSLVSSRNVELSPLAPAAPPQEISVPRSPHPSSQSTYEARRR